MGCPVWPQQIQAGGETRSDGFIEPHHCSSSSFSPSRDIMCGKLFCAGGQEMPRDGSLVTFESCKASFPRNGGADPGMILNGTKCGDGMVSREELFSLFFSSFGFAYIVSSFTRQERFLKGKTEVDIKLLLIRFAIPSASH